MTIRVYAMSGRNKYVLFGLCTYSASQTIFVVVLLMLKGDTRRFYSVFSMNARSPVSTLSGADDLGHLPRSLPLYAPNTRAAYTSCWCCIPSDCAVYPNKIHSQAVSIYISLAVESLVFFTSLIYAFQTTQNSSPTKLHRVVLRDGIIYFLLTFSLNLLVAIAIIHRKV